MQQRVLIGAIVIVVLAALGYVLLLQLGGDAPDEQVAETDTQSEVAVIEEPEIDPDAPTFDIVRVEPGGAAVLAGRSPANAQVTLLVNGESFDQAIADNRGEWVLEPEALLPLGTASLSLRARLLDGREVASEQSVVINVTEADGDLPLVVLHQEGVASRILQEPGVASDGALALKILDYSEDGGLILSGSGVPESIVRIYLDDKLLGDASVNENGEWVFRVKGGDIAPGQYALRLDHIDEHGEVIGRVELPFEQADRQVIAELEPGEVIVQPGNSLWRISRRIYGKGIDYTIIYQANAEQIRDPNLIYPGQVFAIPNR